MEKKVNLPGVLHVAIIMDGNRRWAKQHGLPSKQGHEEGAKALGELVEFCAKTSLKFLTVFAFSTENWKRPPAEVNYLMGMIEKSFEKFKNSVGELPNCKIRVLGAREGLTKQLQSTIAEVEKETSHNTGLNLNLAFNYGGRLELTEAARKLATLVKEGALAPEEITEERLGEFLYTKGMPDPDLVIRTGGDKRFSNFLPWQSVYSEYVFLNTLWPDFKGADFMEAISEFGRRERRFGGGGDDA